MNFYQVMRVMKISMLLLCCCLVQVSAKSYAQKLTIHKSGSTVPEVLNEMRRQAGYDFFYDAKIFRGIAKMNVNIQNASLEQALSACFAELPFTYSVHSNIVIITKLPGDLFSAAKSSKQNSGRLGGKIFDSRGNPLAKATIRVLETNAQTESGIDGSFAMNLPVGTYQLQVSYVSYQTQRITGVVIRAGELTRMDIGMKEASSKIEAVTVTTNFKKATVSGLLAARKNAASVTDGISAEEIARTPDNDMGQVLKRVTGLTTVDNRSVIVRGMSDRYNQAQLDGVNLPSTSQFQRDFAFDIIPTEVVSSVVVNKTATPDVSAEFSGGQVSVNTLDIPEANFNTITIGSGGNNQTTGKDFYRLGERSAKEYVGFYSKEAEIPDNVLPWYWVEDAWKYQLIPLGEKTDPRVIDAELSFARRDLTYRDLDALEQTKRFNSASLQRYKYKGMPNQNIRLAIGRVYDLKDNMRFGFVASANFRNDQNITEFNNVRGSLYYQSWIDSTQFGANGAGSKFKFNSSSGFLANLGLQGNGFKLALKNMYARTYADNFTQGMAIGWADNDMRPWMTQYQLPEALSLLQHQFTAEYQLPWDLKADGMYTINKTETQILDERKLKYGAVTEVDGKLLFQGPDILKRSESGNRSIKSDSRLWTKSNGLDQNWAVSLTKSFNLGSAIKNTLKGGYQGWIKTKDMNVQSILPMMHSYDKENNAMANPTPMVRYAELFTDKYIGDGFGQVFYYPDILGGPVYNGRMTSHSTYLMLDQKFGNYLRLVYGIRREFYNLSNNQEEYVKRTSNPINWDNPLYQHNKKVFEKNVRWLPSMNATVYLTDAINFRASYSKTVIRPDMRETSFFGFYSNELDASVSGEQVFSTVIDNVDARIEWYPSASELVSITGYYKYLDSPIELMHAVDGSSRYVYNNMESAKNLGLEMEVRKNMSFIGGKEWLSNLFVFGNGTLLKSSVNVLSPYDTKMDSLRNVVRKKERLPGHDRPLMGQSPWLVNFGLAYWGESFGATASYNHRGYRTAITAARQNAVQFELAPIQLDLQLYARFLKKRMEVKLNASNLLNQWSRVYRNEKYVSWGEYEESKKSSTPPYPEYESVGDLKYNKADGDVILYRSKEGRRYSISLSYKF